MSEESGSGLQFISAGSVESLYVGSTYELKLGSVNEILVGTEAKINAAVSNTISLQAEMAYKAGCGVEWSNVGGYKLEQGEAFELKEESSQFATKEIKLQAARTLPAQGVGVPLDAVKNRIKGLVVALAAVNVALGATQGALLATNNLGETENRKNEEGVEQDGWTAGSVGVYFSGLSAVSSMIGYAILKASIEALMEAYKALPAVSTITLSETGIKQQANFTATGSQIDMSATGVAIKSGPGTVAMTGAGELSSLSLSATGVAALVGDSEVMVKSPLAVRVGQVSDVGTTSGLTATKALVELNNGEVSSVDLTAASVKISAPEVSMVSEVNGFSANAAEAQMVCGVNSVIVDDMGVVLSAGPGHLAVGSSYVMIDAPLIQLG